MTKPTKRIRKTFRPRKWLDSEQQKTLWKEKPNVLQTNWEEIDGVTLVRVGIDVQVFQRAKPHGAMPMRVLELRKPFINPLDKEGDTGKLVWTQGKPFPWWRFKNDSRD